MSRKSSRRSEDIYSLILNFYPKNYRQEFGEEMKFVFSESLRDANSRDGEGIVNLWTRTIIDSGKSILKENLENRKGGEKMKNKNITRPLVVTLLVLLVPFLGSLFIDGWDWVIFDFAIIGVLVFGTGLAIEFANMKIKNKNHRIIVIALAVLALLVVWVHLAVGIFDFLPLAGS